MPTSAAPPARLERHRGGEFPGNVEYRLDDGGRDLVTVAAVVSAWLAASPEGPTAFGGTAAKSAIKALVEGWSTRMVRALAVRPLSLTELDSVIVPVSYPSLERRLGAMRLAGLVEPMPSRGRGTPYGVSDWLRRAVAPLAAAARWERRHLRAEAPPITNRDAEAAFLLTVPLLRLPADLSGPCRLAVRVGGGEQSALAGVVVSVREGRVEDCVTKLEGDVDAWALGTAAAWLSAVIERDASRLETGGDLRLATELAGGLHGTLFGLAP